MSPCCFNVPFFSYCCRHLLYDLDAHATVDPRRQLILVFGKDDIREEVKRRLKDYISVICNNKLKEISLTAGMSEHCTKGRAIRALVRAYGPWLKVWNEVKLTQEY